MRLVSLNARSIVNKADKLEECLLSLDPHVCVITETWLHELISNDDIVPPGYQLYRRDRGSRGGGVAVAVKDGVDVVTENQIADHESLFLKIKLKETAFHLCAVYRAPDSDERFLSMLYDRLLPLRNKNLILTGDFNLPLINWNNLSLGLSQTSDIILDIMLALDLDQIVTDCTRETSILDLLFISEVFRGGIVTIEPGISDHKLISFSWKVENKITHVFNVESVKEYSRADDVAIIDYIDGNIGITGDDVESSWQQFATVIRHCIKHFVPDRKILKRRQHPWITREIIHTKRRLKRYRKKHGTSTPLFKEIKYDLLSKVSCARAKYFSQTLGDFLKTDPQKFWRHLSKPKEDIVKIKIGDTIITDDAEIAEGFNQFFYGVFTALDEYGIKPTEVTEDDIEITREGVLAMLLKLDIKKSAGPDGIPNVFLRRYAEQISVFLTDVFRLSLACGVVPSDWKIARVVPVYKKGDPLSVPNYRPVSITSSCCKMLEHIVAGYLRRFLSDKNLLSDNQHGFRQGLSTVTQTVLSVHEFARVLDMSGQTDVVFFDFSKAFDKVPHGRLLYKMECMGVPFRIIRWIQAYLKDRRQYVEINKSTSSVLSVHSGVPQGSVLGPLLFLIYVNDLVTAVPDNVSVKLFADDCVVFKQISSDHDHRCVQKSISAIEKWCLEWGMELNIEKTVVLRITRKKSPNVLPYFLHGKVISEVEKYKYLGITLDNKLKWSSHIANICTAALRKLWVLRRKLKTAPAHIKRLAYDTCVRSLLEYASPVWDPYTKKDIMQLEKVNRKAVRFIFHKYRREDSPSQLMHLHNIQTLESRRKRTRLAFLHSSLSGKNKLKLPECVKPPLVKRTRNVHVHSLAPIFAKTNTFKYSFFPRTVQDWNSLPPSVFSSQDFTGALERLFTC